MGDLWLALRHVDLLSLDEFVISSWKPPCTRRRGDFSLDELVQSGFEQCQARARERVSTSFEGTAVASFALAPLAFGSTFALSRSLPLSVPRPRAVEPLIAEAS